MDTLPSAEAKESLRREKANAPDLVVDWIEINGLGNLLAFLTTKSMYPQQLVGITGLWGDR